MTALPSPVSGPGSFKAETSPVCPHLLANPLTALSQATGLPWDSAVTYLVVVLFGEILIHMRTQYYMIHGQLELRIRRTDCKLYADFWLGRGSAPLTPKLFRSQLYMVQIFVTFTRLCQFSSVTQSCPALCDPMNCSTPGLPVHHQLPDFTQTHVHQIGDAIQPSHPLSSPFPLAPNPSQHQSLFQ